MASVNQATVIGFVGDEPKIMQTKNNKAMATFAVATTEKGYTRPDGTKVDDVTDWHNIVFFGKPAEIIGKYVHRGTSIYVQGKMRTRSYEDTNGIKRYLTEIIGDNFQLLDRKSDTVVAQQAPTMQQQSSTNTDDDLPF